MKTQIERNEAFARKLLSSLNRKLPPRKKVRLRFIDDDTHHGLFHETQRFYWIELARQECAECVVEVLLHEYAHLLAWRSGDAKRSPAGHDSQFWIERGRVGDTLYPE